MRLVRGFLISGISSGILYHSPFSILYPEESDILLPMVAPCVVWYRKEQVAFSLLGGQNHLVGDRVKEEPQTLEKSAHVTARGDSVHC